MAKRIAITNLNASTIDILNVIHANASYEYQSLVPKVDKATDIPKVGEVLYGYPAMANQFLNALVNRIALVRVKSATFNNPFNHLKKGYLEFGETVEEIFVNIAKAIEFDPDKAEAREFKRSIPDVLTAFHTMNWRVMYPVTIQDDDLRQAFTDINGVQNLIASIVETVYTAAEYDEYLLFKYLIIKGVAKGNMKPIGITADINENAVAYRGVSNMLTFMSSEYNNSGVLNATPKERQHIFMDAMYNAKFDVEVLARAFNMDKAEFMGRLTLIDSFSTFDNTRFEVIRENSDGLEPVTNEELQLMGGIKAIICDEEWFQVYDNNNKFTEKYVSSGLYWNYFYHTWKTISWSPFANAVVFADSANSIVNDAMEYPSEISFKVADVNKLEDGGVIVTLDHDNLIATASGSMVQGTYEFLQDNLVTSGVAVHKYGAFIINSTIAEDSSMPTIKVKFGELIYSASAIPTSEFTRVGAQIVFTQE